MSLNFERIAFEDLAELAKGRERHQLELKNSSFLVLEHPGNRNRKVSDKGTLCTKLKETLAAECGAFANSNGGRLVFGIVDNDGSLDPTPIPDLHSNTRMEDWVASLLRASLEPPLEHFECYPVVGPGAERVLVIDIEPSEKAPHQSLLDQKYYTRQEKSAVPAQHWLIEAIRSRRIHPRLEPSDVLLKKSIIVKRSGTGEYSDSSVTLDLVFSMTNAGSVLAKRWAFRVDCPFAKETCVFPLDDYRGLNLPSGTPRSSHMVKAVNPLFPTQSVEFRVRLVVPAYWRTDQTRRTLTSFGWTGAFQVPPHVGGSDGDLENWFSLQLSVFADSAQKVVKDYTIQNSDLHWTMVAHLQEEGQLNKGVRLPSGILG